MFAVCIQIPGWTVVNEGGKLKLSQSWKVKSFIKGLEFFQAVANVAETEGIAVFPLVCLFTVL